MTDTINTPLLKEGEETESLIILQTALRLVIFPTKQERLKIGGCSALFGIVEILLPIYKDNKQAGAICSFGIDAKGAFTIYIGVLPELYEELKKKKGTIVEENRNISFHLK